MTSGNKLKRDLKLDNIKYVYIQKIVNIGIPCYVVTYNSRYPNVWISVSKLINLKSSKILQAFITRDDTKSVDTKFVFNNFRLFPPQLLISYERSIPSRSMIIIRDIAGEQFGNFKLIEKTKKGYKYHETV